MSAWDAMSPEGCCACRDASFPVEREKETLRELNKAPDADPHSTEVHPDERESQSVLSSHSQYLEIPQDTQVRGKAGCAAEKAFTITDT